MPKKISQRPVPPLSLEVLKTVEKLEEYSRLALNACDRGMSFNREKATRILRTCVIETVDAQLEYLIKLPTYHPSWIDQVVEETIASAIGLCPSTSFNYTETREELERTLSAHLNPKIERGEFQPAKPVPIGKVASSLGQQLDRLRDECRLSVENLAEAVGIAPRTLYRHLSGDSLPQLRQIASYEKFFSRKLGKDVRLKVSSKRQ